jgi:hypothetical protein
MPVSIGDDHDCAQPLCADGNGNGHHPGASLFEAIVALSSLSYCAEADPYRTRPISPAGHKSGASSRAFPLSAMPLPLHAMALALTVSGRT